MRPDRPSVPEDPIAFIQEQVRRGRVLWTYHAWMRLQRRTISRVEIIQSPESYLLVEAYPDDKYLPTYLVLARSGPGTFPRSLPRRSGR